EAAEAAGKDGPGGWGEPAADAVAVPQRGDEGLQHRAGAERRGGGRARARSRTDHCEARLRPRDEPDQESALQGRHPPDELARPAGRAAAAAAVEQGIAAEGIGGADWARVAEGGPADRADQGDREG